VFNEYRSAGVIVDVHGDGGTASRDNRADFQVCGFDAPSGEKDKP
jgi:hypothetical protein